jgi:signal transduction histidine kinase/ActR/RegA family two-component response regulator
MIDFFAKLLDPTGFVPRRLCGQLANEAFLVELLRYSDLAIWLAYLAIPSVILFFLYRKRSVPFLGIFLLFVAFILGCGFTHFVDAILIDTPVYRLSAAIKALTAGVSWATVFALIPAVPKALALRTPEELQYEIAQRIKAQQALEKARDELENRVRERTAELEREIHQRQKFQEERELLLHREMTARAEAEAANVTKDEFLATLSHELRTPLNAILGWVQLLRGGTLEPAMVERGLEVLERNTRAQAQLIDDLLDVSRIVSGKLRIERKPVAVREVVRAAIDTIRPAAEARGVRLVVAREVAATLLGDSTRIQQIIWNLLSNAVKFTPRDGQVTIDMRLESPHVVIEVQDTGMGIAPDLLPHVFERFRQADSSSTRKHGGLGLGLAIARHLVELHGGEITAASAGLGQGATFRVRLPLYLTSSLPLDASRPLRASIEGLRILVVEDVADTLELFDMLLSGNGAQVLTCRSAHEALRLIRGFTPDLLISDIGMPDMDGYALIRAIRQLPPDQGGQVPAIAVTAFARSEDRDQALAAGYQLHLSKPIVPADLMDAIRSVVGWTTPESP